MERSSELTQRDPCCSLPPAISHLTMPFIRPAILHAQPLLIKQIAAETAQLIADEGATILSLAQGTPNLPLFPAAVEAMTAHIATGRMPYTDVAGMMDVRETAAKFINQFYELPEHAAPVSASNVMITAGAAQSVYNTLALSVGCADDVVLSPLPAYGLYLHQTNVLGGTFDAIPTEAAQQFKPTIAQLQAAFDKHTVTESVKAASGRGAAGGHDAGCEMSNELTSDLPWFCSSPCPAPPACRRVACGASFSASRTTRSEQP